MLAPPSRCRNASTSEIRERGSRRPTCRLRTARGRGGTTAAPSRASQYAIHCRRADPDRELTVDAVHRAIGRRAARSGEEVLLDENDAAGASDYFALGVFDVSPDHTAAGVRRRPRREGSATCCGSVTWRPATDLDDEIDGVYYSSAWSTRQPHLLLRPARRGHAALAGVAPPVGAAGRGPARPTRRTTSGSSSRVGLTRSERFVLIIDAESKMTSEIHFLDASRPDRPLPGDRAPHGRAIEYDVEHAEHPERGRRVARSSTNADGAENFARRRGARRPSPAGPTGAPVVPHRPEVRLDVGRRLRRPLVVISERERGLERLRIIDLGRRRRHGSSSSPNPSTA